MGNTIHPLHSSVRLVNKISPHNMEKLKTPFGTAAFLERTAIEIFTDMVNAGQSFQSALAAIYLSGMQHAIALQKEINQ